MTFMSEPEEPTEEDCCQTGCVPCVFDIYRENLKKWKSKSYLPRSDLLSQTCFKAFQLTEVRDLTYNTKLCTFKSCVEYNGLLSIIPGQHLVLRSDNENRIIRSYTVLQTGENSSFQVLIKVYKNGLMSQYIKNLAIGDTTYWRGPYGDFKYEKNKYKNIVMICIGTGIAPMYAISKQILSYEDDETLINLLFGSKNVEDIIFRQDLVGLSAYWNLTCTHYLSEKCDMSLKKRAEIFVNGKITQEIIKDFTLLNNTLFLICGSDTFCESTKNTILENNIACSNIHVF